MRPAAIAGAAIAALLTLMLMPGAAEARNSQCNGYDNTGTANTGYKAQGNSAYNWGCYNN